MERCGEYRREGCPLRECWYPGCSCRRPVTARDGDEAFYTVPAAEPSTERDDFSEAAGMVGLYALIFLGMVGITVLALVDSWDEYGWSGPWFIPAFATALMVVAPLCIWAYKVIKPPPLVLCLGLCALFATVLALPCIFAR